MMNEVLVTDDKLRAELVRANIERRLRALNIETVDPTKMIIASMAVLGSAPGLADFLDSIPKGATPNRYKPHQGNKEMQRRKGKS